MLAYINSNVVRGVSCECAADVEEMFNHPDFIVASFNFIGVQDGCLYFTAYYEDTSALFNTLACDHAFADGFRSFDAFRDYVLKNSELFGDIWFFDFN